MAHAHAHAQVAAELEQTPPALRGFHVGGLEEGTAECLAVMVEVSPTHSSYLFIYCQGKIHIVTDCYCMNVRYECV
jgi:hypothetical protein